ncbi:MAG: hypothetical protein QXS93_00365 [Candidatus Micrarchaeia archaeon]
MRRYFCLIFIALIVCISLIGCVQELPINNAQNTTYNTTGGLLTDGGQFVDTTLQKNKEAPTETEKLNVSSRITIRNEYTGKNFSVHEIVNESGVYIYFDDPIPKFSGSVPAEEYEAYLYSVHRTEANHLILPILNKSYAFSCLDYNTKSRNSRVCLAEEKTYTELSVFGCEKLPTHERNASYIETSDGKYALAGYGYKLDNYDYIAMCKLISEDACGYEYKHRVGANSYLPGGDILHVWVYTAGPTPCSSKAAVSVFRYEFVLENASGVILDWNATTKNQALKSISIPSTSPIYYMLTGKKGQK